MQVLVTGGTAIVGRGDAEGVGDLRVEGFRRNSSEAAQRVPSLRSAGGTGSYTSLNITSGGRDMQWSPQPSL